MLQSRGAVPKIVSVIVGGATITSVIATVVKLREATTQNTGAEMKPVIQKAQNTKKSRR
jgi:hypothetical protein